MLATYVLQVALLAIAGSLIGVGLAAAAIRSIPASLTESFGGLPYGLTVSAVLQGLTVGLLVSVLFALVPLLDVRRIKPLLLIRGADGRSATAMTGAAGRGGFVSGCAESTGCRLFSALAVGSALVGVASWQAGSWRAGAAVSVGFAASSLVLYLAAFVLVRLVTPLASAPWFPLRHAVISLRRPGNQTRVILLAVGLGSFFVLGVRALQSNLIAEFSVGMDRGGADMFIIDVQRDQAEGVEALLRERQDPGASPARLVPVLRARVTAVQAGARSTSRTSATCAAAARSRASTPSPIATTWNRTSGSSRGRSGRRETTRRGAVRSLDRGGHPRALQHPRRRRDAVRRPRPPVARAGDERPPRRMG